MNEWKLMLKYDETTIIKKVLENTRPYTNNLIVSGGYRYEELKNHLEREDQVLMVFNPHYKKGMLTSIKAALPFVKSDKFFIMLSDMPLVPSGIFRDMSKLDFEDALFPVYDGKRGHPVLVDSSIKPLIMEAPDSGRMKDILENCKLCDFPVECEGVLVDIDTREEYRKLSDR